jgi:UDP-glucose 4-epimerase
MSSSTLSDATRDVERVVILGHSGYIGRHVEATLRTRAPQVEIIGTSKSDLDLAQKNQAERLNALLTPETAVILLSGIKKQYGDTLEIFEENVAMVANVCRSLATHPVARVVYFSSAEVYGGGADDLAIDESTPVRPRSYYGAAKFASERILAKAVEPAGTASLVILRPALVYGPAEEGTFYGPTGFVRAAMRDEEISLWGEGDELRELVYVDDLAEAVTDLVFGSYQGVLNIASGISHSFMEIATTATQITGARRPVGSKTRTGNKVDQGFNNSLLREVLPNLRFTTLAAGMQTIVDAERQAKGATA